MKKNILFVILCVCVHFSLSAQSLLGSPQFISGEEEGGYSVFAAHLDGDKYVDVLSSSTLNDQIMWYRNEEGKSFGEIQVIGTGVEAVFQVKAADFDGDGDQDVFAISESMDKVFWYRNEGNGEFGELRLISTETDSPRGIYAEDVDSDGDIDVLSASHWDGKISWYANDGEGNFGEQQVIHTDVESSSSVSAADMDGDGDIDVLSTSYNSSLLKWHENLGDASSWKTHLISGDYGGFNSVSAADLDGDGDLDVLATSYWQGAAVWFENDGNGGFEEFSVLFEGDNVKDAHAVDLDKDGDLDVLVAVFGVHKVVWFENDGQGNFGAEKLIRENAQYARGVIAADVDRDGDSDVLGVASGYGDVFWCENLLKPNQIVTLLFHDRNENGLYDNGEEQPLFDFKLLLNPTANESFTNLEGYNYLFADYGDYDLTFEPNPLWELTTALASYPIEYKEDTILPVYQFGFRPTQLVSEVIPYLSASPTRCDRVATYWLNYSNTGTVTAKGQISLEVNEGMEFVEAIPPPSLIEGNKLTWNFTDLYPTYENKIRVRFEMPDFNSMGMVFESRAELELFHENEIPIYTHSTEYDSELLCSYDPNDKLARSNILGQSEFAYIEDTILYTVRFQNTGNDTAFNIRIEDVLDKKLDWTTFHPITASHDFRTELNRETGLATFYFDDILLPDSTANEEESHGFVTFGIASLADVGDKTEVENTAGIFFDFNPAIVTNTAVLTLIEEVETGIDALVANERKYLVEVYPNPFSDFTTIEVEDLPEGNYHLELMDILGRKIRELKMENGEWKIERGELEDGMYVFRILKENSELIGGGKVLVE